MLKRGKGDFLNIYYDWITGQADFELVHCPLHEPNELSCRILDNIFFCFVCGEQGTRTRLALRARERGKTLEMFYPENFQRHEKKK